MKNEMSTTYTQLLTSPYVATISIYSTEHFSLVNKSYCIS